MINQSYFHHKRIALVRLLTALESEIPSQTNVFIQKMSVDIQISESCQRIFRYMSQIQGSIPRPFHPAVEINRWDVIHIVPNIPTLTWPIEIYGRQTSQDTAFP